MLDLLVKAVGDWIQKNPGHTVHIAKKAFEEIKHTDGYRAGADCVAKATSAVKRSFQNGSSRSKANIVSCPNCGRQYNSAQVNGRKKFPCQCGARITSR